MSRCYVSLRVLCLSSLIGVAAKSMRISASAMLSFRRSTSREIWTWRSEVTVQMDSQLFHSPLSSNFIASRTITGLGAPPDDDIHCLENQRVDDGFKLI